MRLLLLFLPLLLAACRDQRDNELLPAPDSHLRPDALAIGQTSRYVLFRGENYFEHSNFNFTYLPDTLVLSVVSAHAGGFVIEEKLTPGSASRHGANHLYDPTAVYQYYWKVERDTLFLRPLTDTCDHCWQPSHFTFGYNFALPLAPITAPETDIQGWKTTHPYTESYWTATDPAYSLFGLFYANLNILTDNRDMAFDGNGHWYAYSANNGIVKTADYGWWTQSGLGWDLLPD